MVLKPSNSIPILWDKVSDLVAAANRTKIDISLKINRKTGALYLRASDIKDNTLYTISVSKGLRESLGVVVSLDTIADYPIYHPAPNMLIVGRKPAQHYCL